jgi:hypothetical protein
MWDRRLRAIKTVVQRQQGVLLTHNNDGFF